MGDSAGSRISRFTLLLSSCLVEDVSCCCHFSPTLAFPFFYFFILILEDSPKEKANSPSRGSPRYNFSYCMIRNRDNIGDIRSEFIKTVTSEQWWGMGR